MSSLPKIGIFSYYINGIAFGEPRSVSIIIGIIGCMDKFLVRFLYGNLFYFGCIGFTCALILYNYRAASRQGLDGALVSWDEVLSESKHTHMMITDQGIVRYRLYADHILQYESGNVELTGHVHILQNDHSSQLDPFSMQADRVIYNKSLQVCMAQGHVLIEQPKDEFTLETEQLSYYVDQGLVSTNHNVSIKKGDTTLCGNAFFAKQDFKSYHVGEPSGSVDLVVDDGN